MDSYLNPSNSLDVRRRAPRRRLTALALVMAVCTAGSLAAQEDAVELIPPADAESFPSGIRSQVLKAGAGESYPSDRDLMAVHFIGWSPYGDKLYTSYEGGKPLIMNLTTVFPGWKEALERMVAGERRRIWLPENLMASGRGPQGASIFDLHLLALKPIPTPPDNLSQPPEGAERTPSGASTVRLEAGKGEEYPAPDSAVLVHYMGWTTDGRSFDSSFTRGRPTAFKLGEIMPAFAETVQMMVAGEKRRVWIPGPVAARNWVGAPKGMLVFEVELVRVLPPEALQKMQPAGEPPPPKPG